MSETRGAEGVRQAHGHDPETPALQLAALLGSEPARRALKRRGVTPLDPSILADEKALAVEVCKVGREAMARAALCVAPLLPIKPKHKREYERMVAKAAKIIEHPVVNAREIEVDLESPDLADVSSVLMTVDLAMQREVARPVALPLHLAATIRCLLYSGLDMTLYTQHLRDHLVPWLLKDWKDEGQVDGEGPPVKD